ncbi:MAG TPA: hypothetical protein PKD91_11345, partial [Bacteroidia bacterium]|nr:hypothetical protein [Bacteroidia bacterium]
KINGKNAIITSVSATMIVVNVAANTGTGYVVVEANGEGTTGPVFNYIYTVSVSTYTGFSGTAGLTDGDASIAQFHSPRGLAIDNQDNIYVADELNHCIRKVSPGGTVTTFAGSGIAGFADGDPGVARFKNPYDVAVDPINGYFYVADKLNHCVRRLSLSGYVTTAAGIPGTAGYVDAPGGSARFNNPTSVTVKGEIGDVFVADAANHCIRKIDNTDIVTTFAGSSTPGQLDGSGTSARFTYPTDISFDSTGAFYVADRDNHNIRKISVTGTVSTVAG